MADLHWDYVCEIADNTQILMMAYTDASNDVFNGLFDTGTYVEVNPAEDLPSGWTQVFLPGPITDLQTYVGSSATGEFGIKTLYGEYGLQIWQYGDYVFFGTPDATGWTDTQSAPLPTTDDTPTTAAQINFGNTFVGMIMLKVYACAVCTGGTSGTPGDGAVFEFTGRVLVNNGTVTIKDFSSTYTNQDDAWTLTATSPTTAQLNINVVGQPNVNIDWNILTQYRIAI